MSEIYVRVSIFFKEEVKVVMAKRFEASSIPRVGEYIVFSGGVEDSASVLVSAVKHWIDDDVVVVECSFDCDFVGMMVEDEGVDSIAIEEDAEIERDIADLNGASEAECDAMYESKWMWTYYKRALMSLGFADAKLSLWGPITEAKGN